MTHKPRVHVVATQHLDVAWLWPRVPYGEELMRQCFERATEMIEADAKGRFVFSRSTAWSFWIVEQRYPQLFDRIRTYVAQGRIELCGGEWVEPDHLIPSGESLVRQAALGQWYYLETFGKTASVCWDPDIFGHPHSLPQILLKCGLKGFYAHRCRPTDAEGTPLHQFAWESPDGSRVIYLAGNWIKAPDAEAIGRALATEAKQALPAIHVVTGLSSDRRITMQTEWVSMPDATAAALELPSCRWSTAADVLADMQTYGDALPVVRGELGFQFTGTYTSNGYNKRTNRSVERILLNAEKAAAWASTYGFRYPHVQLTQAWRDHCVNQFHDIICGCSVAEVHVEDRALWADVIRRASFARDEALAFLCDRIHSGRSDGAQGGTLLAVFNLLPWTRTAAIELPLEATGSVAAATPGGEPLQVQLLPGSEQRTALVAVPEVPGIGHRLIRVRPVDGEMPAVDATAALVIENQLVRAQVDSTTGELVSLLDKRSGYESIRPGGRGNRLVFLEDADERMPAWTIHYTGRVLDPGSAESIGWVTYGPIRQMIRVVRTVQLHPALPVTRIVQDISLDAGSPVVTFATRGDWQALNVMLKAAFDVAFTCNAVAASAPYGVVERDPTREPGDASLAPDTMAEDEARSAGGSIGDQDRYMQSWVDVSDGRRGLLFINNGLYGYDAAGHRLRLSLLRAPLDPTPQLGDTVRPLSRQITGLGPFAFAYGVAPHAGGWREADALHLSEALDNPLIVRPVRDGFEQAGVWRDWWVRTRRVRARGATPTEIAPGFLELVAGKSAVVTVVKAAEDGDGLVLRVFESQGRQDDVLLRFHRPVHSAIETDMLERPWPDAGALTVSSDERHLAFPLAPWEVKTIRVRLHAGTV